MKKILLFTILFTLLLFILPIFNFSSGLAFEKVYAVTQLPTATNEGDKNIVMVYEWFANSCANFIETKEALSQARIEANGFDKYEIYGYEGGATGCSGEEVSFKQLVAENPGTSPIVLYNQYIANNYPLGQAFNLSATLYDEKPASGVLWFEQQYYAITGQNDVYAQAISNSTEFYNPGPGFSLLQPLQGLWAWSRNLAYVAFIILIIGVGFLILFRDRMGGDAPITIFNSIPTMILSLVLITFSYAICALFVDVITIGTGLTQSILVSSPGAPGYENVWNQSWQASYPVVDGQGQLTQDLDKFKIQPDDPQVSIWQIFNTANASFCDNSTSQENCSLTNLLPTDIGAGNGLMGAAGAAIGFIQFLGVDQTLIAIIMGFASFSAAIKLFLTLLRKYIQLTVGVIISPWYFFIAAIPSKTQTTIMDFLKVQLGAALSFVAVYFVFLFLVVFVQSDVTTNFTWIPPLLGYVDVNFLQGNLVGGVITFGIFLAAPSIPDYVDKFLDIPSEGGIVAEAGQRFTGAAGQAASYAKTAGGAFLGKQFGIRM